MCDEFSAYPEGSVGNGVADPKASGIVRHDELDVYKIAFRAASEVFEVTKGFPAEERFSLTDQVRKSSRSVCANIAEGWRKRRYEAAFQSSLNIAEAEAAETQTWLRFAEECGYLSTNTATVLVDRYESVIAKLVVMINNPKPWILKGHRHA